jgi:hypothetical protein
MPHPFVELWQQLLDRVDGGTPSCPASQLAAVRRVARPEWVAPSPRTCPLALFGPLAAMLLRRPNRSTTPSIPLDALFVGPVIAQIDENTRRRAPPDSCRSLHVRPSRTDCIVRP